MLDKNSLKSGIKSLLNDMRGVEDAATGDEQFATRLADLIDAFVKSGDGKITSASMFAGSNAVTGTQTVIVKQQ